MIEESKKKALAEKKANNIAVAKKHMESMKGHQASLEE